MKILAIETATIAGSVAICDDSSGLIGEVKINVRIAHAERLMPSIKWLLDSSRVTIEEIDAFAVSIGPGSFTGLRIGLSTVKGFAFATNKPVVSVPTLDAFARTVPFSAYQICPLLDARKDEVFAGLYRWADKNVMKIMPERAISPGDLLQEISDKTVFIGDGIIRYGEMIRDMCGDNAIFPPPSIMSPSASTVGEIAFEKMKQGDIADPVSLSPLLYQEIRGRTQLEGVMIRDMSGHDLSDVHMLESICDPMPWSVNALGFEIDNKDSILKVAVRAEKIIGYVCIRSLLDITHVMKISVLPDDRRNGIGSALFSESLKQLTRNKPDVNSVTLEVRDSNSAAIKLYNNFGFTETGRRKDYYKNPLEDGIVMQLDM